MEAVEWRSRPAAAAYRPSRSSGRAGGGMRAGHVAGCATGPFATWLAVVCPHRAAVGGCAAMLVGCVLQLAWCRAGGRGCCANLRACWGHKTRKKSAASKAPKCRLLPLKRHCALHLHCWLIYVPLKLRALSRASSHECGGAEGSMARRGQICAQEGAGGRQGRGWEGWGGAARRERHHVASGKSRFLPICGSCYIRYCLKPVAVPLENP